MEKYNESMKLWKPVNGWMKKPIFSIVLFIEKVWKKKKRQIRFIVTC